MIMRKLKGFMLGIMITVVLLTGCSPKEEALTKVRIAHFPNVTHAQALINRQTDTLQAKLGDDIAIEYYVFNAGPAEIEAFFAGQLDIGYIGPVPAINGNIKSGGDIVIIAGATNAGAMMVTGSNSNITSIKDLANKRIAIPQIGNTQHLSLMKMLSDNGLSDTTKGGTVEVLPVANPDVKNLLSSGQIDAAYVPEPWGSRLVVEMNAKIVLDEKEVFRNGEYSTAVVIARKDFVDKHPDIVEKFLEAHIEATLFIQNDVENAKTMINKEIATLTGQQLDERVIDSVYERLYASYDPILDSVMEFMEISKAEDFIASTTTREKLFRFQILNDILKRQSLSIVE